jgi:tRNA A37 N6-isopentenylltransferase MiaA
VEEVVAQFAYTELAKLEKGIAYAIQTRQRAILGGGSFLYTQSLANGRLMLQDRRKKLLKQMRRLGL